MHELNSFPNLTLPQAKRRLRGQILTLRDRLSPSEIRAKSQAIWDRLSGTDLFRNANLIFFFLGYDKEVQTKFMVENALSEGKRIAVPRVLSDREMAFYEITDLEGLVPGFRGILEPAPGLEPVRERPDLILLPGTVFDEKGGRIGYGKGYYDHFLSDQPAQIPRIALCFDLQVLSHIPTEDHDIRAHRIITEKRIISCP
ncbi:MAG: 5-formyltetrahydrofolate cyclo-ligase [Lachnospiraceae bacterium]|nr:5-formyltetrahydrofolate cyclo-ligase [Lachnospiraceae bacterium]